MIFIKYKKSNEYGVGNVMVLAGVAIAAVVWCVFMTVVTIIGNNHQANRKKDLEYFENQKPKKKVEVRREVKGYRLSY